MSTPAVLALVTTFFLVGCKNMIPTPKIESRRFTTEFIPEKLPEAKAVWTQTCLSAGCHDSISIPSNTKEPDEIQRASALSTHITVRDLMSKKEFAIEMSNFLKSLDTAP